MEWCWDKWGVIAIGVGVYFWADDDVLKLFIETITQIL